MVEPLRKPRRHACRTCGGREGARLSCVKTKQLPLGGPVDRYFKRQSHQLLGGELRRIFAVNNRSDDIGRQRRKAQEARDVAGRNVLLAGNSAESAHFSASGALGCRELEQQFVKVRDRLGVLSRLSPEMKIATFNINNVNLQ